MSSIMYSIISRNGDSGILADDKTIRIHLKPSPLTANQLLQIHPDHLNIKNGNLIQIMSTYIAIKLELASCSSLTCCFV